MPASMRVPAHEPVLPEDAFELAWQEVFTTGAPVPDIAGFLPASGAADYRETLVRLIAIDLERRHCATHHYKKVSAARETDGVAQASVATTTYLRTPPLREYLERFQIPLDAPEIPDLIAAEYEALWRAGRRVNIADYERDYPAWKTELQKVLHEREEELKQDRLAVIEYETPRIEGFVIHDELDRGGFSVVYLATEESVSRQVAIKIALHVPRSTHEFARYESEPQRMAKLPGHGVVEVYRAGVYQGRPYLICKYLPKGNLIRYAKTEREGSLLPPRQAAMILRDVARTMAEVHRRGVIHRDLKPGNILLDEFETPHVMDFGLSWDKSNELPPDAPDLLEGTPPYMPPEQAANERPAAFEPAVDIYSLGATLYWLLTGKPPFLGTSIQETLQLVAKQEPASPRRDNPALSRDLETICLKCLEKKPERRYGTADELADDLDRFLKNEPVRARPISAVARGWRWSQRNPWLAGASTVAMVLLLLALGVSLSYAQYTVVVRQRSDRRFYTAQASRAHSLIEKGRVAPTLRLLDTINPTRMPNAPRGFEWDYALRLCHHDRWELRDHATPIMGLAVSEETGLIASADDAGFISLADNTTGKQVANTDVGQPIVAIALSGDGKHLAVGTADTQVRIYQVTATGVKFLREHAGHALAVSDLVFHPKKPWLASASQEGCIRIWNVETGGEEHALIDVRPPYLKRLLFEPNGDGLLLLAGTDNVRATALLRWSPETKEVRSILDRRDLGAVLRDVVLSRDGQRLFVLSDNSKLSCFRSMDDKWERDWSMPARSDLEPRERVLISGGNWVAVAHLSGEALVVHHEATGRVLRTYRGPTDRIINMAVNSRGDLLAAATRDRVVKVWDGNRDADFQTLTGHDATIRTMAISPDGRWLASGGYDHGVFCWDLEKGALHERYGDHTVDVPPPLDGVPQFPNKIISRGGHRHFVTGLAFSPDNKFILSASWDRTVIVWDVLLKKQVRTFTTNVEAPTCLAMHPLGKEIAICGFNGPVFRFDWKTGTLLSKWGSLKDRGVFAAYDPQGKHLAIGNMLGRIAVRDVATGTIAYELSGFEGDVTRVSYSPDGKCLAAGGKDLSVRVWQLPPKNPPLLLEGHTTEISGLTFMPDGRLASTSGGQESGSLKLWDLPTEQEVMALTGGYNHVCATADGTRLLCSTGRWFTIRVLDSRPLNPNPRRQTVEVVRSPLGVKKSEMVVLGSFETDQILEDQSGEKVWISASVKRRYIGVVVSVPLWLEMTDADEFKQYYEKFNDNPHLAIDQAHASLVTPKHFQLHVGDQKYPAGHTGSWPFSSSQGVNPRSLLRRHFQDPKPYERELRLVVFEVPADVPLEKARIQMRDRDPVPLPKRKLAAPTQEPPEAI
jgi:WD40 repeat protein